MKQTLKIDHHFTDLNRYIRLERTPRRGHFLANEVKQNHTQAVQCLALEQKLKKIPENARVEITFMWYVASNVDPDNLAFTKKFILDGLVKAGILKDDSIRHVRAFHDVFIPDTVNELIVDLEY